MEKKKILIQLDPDKHASAFDRVVACDSGVDEVFSYSSVAIEDVEEIVHGAIFTRGPADLKNTAFFLGGRNITIAEDILTAVRKSFFGPLRCSVLLDANGANTTASAAVLAAAAHLDLAQTAALVLAATGPVGRRIARLLAKLGATVWVGSRSPERSEEVAQAVRERLPKAKIYGLSTSGIEAVEKHTDSFNLIASAGAAGIRMLDRQQVLTNKALRVLIDLNGVPPTGIEGVEPGDNAREMDGLYQYGAIGVGQLKMKIHKAAIRQLFESNSQILDAEEVFEIGQKSVASRA